jgi:hypothetical protein
VPSASTKSWFKKVGNSLNKTAKMVGHELGKDVKNVGNAVFDDIKDLGYKEALQSLVTPMAASGAPMAASGVMASTHKKISPLNLSSQVSSPRSYISPRVSQGYAFGVGGTSDDWVDDWGKQKFVPAMKATQFAPQNEHHDSNNVLDEIYFKGSWLFPTIMIRKGELAVDSNNSAAKMFAIVECEDDQSQCDKSMHLKNFPDSRVKMKRHCLVAEVLSMKDERNIRGGSTTFKGVKIDDDFLIKDRSMELAQNFFNRGVHDSPCAYTGAIDNFRVEPLKGKVIIVKQQLCKKNDIPLIYNNTNEPILFDKFLLLNAFPDVLGTYGMDVKPFPQRAKKFPVHSKQGKNTRAVEWRKISQEDTAKTIPMEKEIEKTRQSIKELRRQAQNNAIRDKKLSKNVKNLQKREVITERKVKKANAPNIATTNQQQKAQKKKEHDQALLEVFDRKVELKKGEYTIADSMEEAAAIWIEILVFRMPGRANSVPVTKDTIKDFTERIRIDEVSFLDWSIDSAMKSLPQGMLSKLMSKKSVVKVLRVAFNFVYKKSDCQVADFVLHVITALNSPDVELDPDVETILPFEDEV